MSVGRGKTYLKTFTISAAALTLFSCSSKRSSSVGCVNTSKTGQNQPNSLQLSDSTNALRDLGGGYLDIKTKDASGKENERRCSMMVTQDDQDQSQIKVWTAIHCLYDAASDEFINSSYTLQIHYKGGYFPASVKFDRFENLHRFAKVLQPLLLLLPEKDRNRWRFSASNDSIEPCQDATKEFKDSIGNTAKKIACFSKNEMRVLSGKISVDEKYSKLLDAVLTGMREYREQHISRLPEREKKFLKLREKTLSILDHSELYIRNYGYWINDKHCTLPEADLPVNGQGERETRKFCPHRESLLNISKTQFPEEYQILKPIAEANISSLAELKDLHSSVYMCNFENLDEINLSTDKLLTVCDREQLIRLIWNVYVQDAAVSFKRKLENKTEIHGFAPDGYFSIFTNKQIASDPKQSKPQATSRTFFLSESLSNISPKKFNNQLLLINYDSAGSELDLTKTDSGSIFSMMGIVPVGTLSTVDGEPTSGGASILPLPTVAEEQVNSPTPVSSLNCVTR